MERPSRIVYPAFDATLTEGRCAELFAVTAAKVLFLGESYLGASLTHLPLHLSHDVTCQLTAYGEVL